MPHTDTLVSIVIPVYNRESLILETLRSAQNQTYPNIEIVIVDNKSTDNTWNLLLSEAEKDQRISLFQNETNVGPVRNWEKCFHYAKGEYIKILWSDDLIEPTFVEETMEVFEEDVAFVMTGIITFSEKEIRSITEFQKYTELDIDTYYEYMLLLKTDLPVSPGCAIFRTKDLIENLIIEIPNHLNLQYSKYGAGNDLLLFLLTANTSKYKKVRSINKLLSKFRHHDTSITTSHNSNLNIYYDWAKWIFIKNHCNKNKIKSTFKSLIIINTYLYKYPVSFLLSIDGIINLTVLTNRIKSNFSKKLKQTLAKKNLEE
jgi:glycosyltransferase involved in cell wall biosynthesis